MTEPHRARILALASGGGSNVGALLAHLEALGDARMADVVAVASDRPAAGALARARSRGIETVLIQGKAGMEGEPLEAVLARIKPALIVLAGYLRLVPPDVVRHYRGRIVNVHPAPLPAFGGHGMYGLRVHHAVLASGAAATGPTVHFVDEIYDHGAVIAQQPVAVLPSDTPESLAARVLAAEHALYPAVVHAVAAGDVMLAHDGSVVWRDHPLTADAVELRARAGAMRVVTGPVDSRPPVSNHPD